MNATEYLIDASTRHQLMLQRLSEGERKTKNDQ